MESILQESQGLKVCTRCKQSKPLARFPRCRRERDGLQDRCRDCFAEMQREYRRKRPKGYWKNKDKRYALKKRYGLSFEQYEQMVLDCRGLCEICGKDPRFMGDDDRHKILHVDHDHKEGYVRGLLCNGCNRAIGLINENINTAKAMVEYLEKHGTR